MSETSLHDVVHGRGRGPQRRDRRAAEKRRKRRRRRSWAVVLVSLVVVGGAVGGAWLGLRPMIASWTEPKDWTGPGTGSVVVQVAPGASGNAIAQVLAKAGVVKTARSFSEAYSNDAAAQSIQPGSYRLRQHMSAKEALTLLLDPKSRLSIKVTIPEGRRAVQVLDLLAKQTGLTRTALDAAAKNPGAIGLPAAARGNIEGYLFPATYTFEPGITATDVLRAMVTQGQATMDSLGVPAAEQRTVLIKASLVQAEGRRPDDMGKIATVLDNRLRKGIKLGLDSTVKYATGKFGNVSTTLKDTQFPSPYNTYYVKGLPVGPIGNPGADAIKAVLDPTPGQWLYFTTVNPDTGETKFAVTEAEKAKMDEEFRAWQKAHPGQ